MPSKTNAPYGSWESPITAELITKGGLRLAEVRVDGNDIYWLEGRPEEAGRYVIVRRSPETLWMMPGNQYCPFFHRASTQSPAVWA